MSKLSQCNAPGILLVLTKPKAPEHLQDFHDWYDTEHGPMRLRLGQDYFSNGFRYKSIGDQSTTWLAIYDMNRLSAAAEKTYTSIRENRSERERLVLRDKVNVLSRQFLQTIAQTETVQAEPAAVICVVFMETSELDEVSTSTWYSSDGFGLLQRAGFGRRSRLFRLVEGPRQQPGQSLLCAVHELSESAENHTAKLHAKVTQLLSQRQELLSSRTSFFTFHRAFSAEDYRNPDLSSRTIESHVSTERKGRL